MGLFQRRIRIAQVIGRMAAGAFFDVQGGHSVSLFGVRAAAPAVFVQFVGQPHLDQRLTGDAELLGLPVQTCDNPGREIHVHPLGLDIEAACLGPIDMGGHVFARVEAFVEFVKRAAIGVFSRIEASLGRAIVIANATILGSTRGSKPGKHANCINQLTQLLLNLLLFHPKLFQLKSCLPPLPNYSYQLSNNFLIQIIM